MTLYRKKGGRTGTSGWGGLTGATSGRYTIARHTGDRKE
jgi:hypothetical protein